MPLSQQTIIVTGAAGNLGTAVCVLLASRGARLICVDRTEESLQATHAHLPAGTEALLLAGYDLTKDDEGRRMVAAGLERFGAITGLVNTIGGFRTGSVVDDALGQWNLMMDLNARAALVISAAVLPTMVARHFGRIVHISAGAGQKAGSGVAAYAASKAALIRIVEAIAAEHRADGITANCVLPGTIDTPQNRAAMPNAKPSSFVAPAAIAELIAFLLTPEASAVTGGAIPATGTL